MNRTFILGLGIMILGSIVMLSNVPLSDSVLTYQMLVTVTAEKSPIMEGEFPVIVGTVKDEAYKPVANANVLILYANEAVATTTDEQGNFRYQSAIPGEPGTYEIDVTATKAGYIKGMASSTYKVDSFQEMSNSSSTSLRTINGLPVYSGNYTVYLGRVTQWNLETTCFVSFSDKYMRFLNACDLYEMAGPDSFQPDQQVLPPVSVMQYNDTYRLFPQSVYTTAYYMGNDTLSAYVSETWQNYTAP